jgi:hypothetical protein
MHGTVTVDGVVVAEAELMCKMANVDTNPPAAEPAAVAPQA